jgi:hypothetical protein
MDTIATCKQFTSHANYVSVGEVENVCCTSQRVPKSGFRLHNLENEERHCVNDLGLL